MTTKKTITGITLAAALVLGLAACSSDEPTAWAPQDSYGVEDAYETEDSGYDYGLDENGQFDSDLAQESFEIAWDILDEETKGIACDAWLDDSISMDEFMYMFNQGAGGVIREEDVASFFNSAC